MINGEPSVGLSTRMKIGDKRIPSSMMGKLEWVYKTLRNKVVLSLAAKKWRRWEISEDPGTKNKKCVYQCKNIYIYTRQLYFVYVDHYIFDIFSKTEMDGRVFCSKIRYC